MITKTPLYCFFIAYIFSSSVIANTLIEKQQVVKHYSDVAHAVYQDSQTTAQRLQVAVQNLVSNPSQQTLDLAKLAWKAARVPYQQSEVYRFGNPNVDEWEGQLNAWPLDEGLIDYVASSYDSEMGNIGGHLNIIANTSIALGDNTINAEKITAELLASLNELGGSEANVATGYHAIEFLLWGQDLNGTGPGAGNRAFTDYASGEKCTNGHCKRRAEYLLAVTQLLVDDLKLMEAQWAGGGSYRTTLENLDPNEVLTRALFGMGSLSLGELAGERLKVALEANSPEDEHDCFSDNTHYSHYYNAKGIRNVYTGQYTRVDGTTMKGASISDLVARLDPSIDLSMQKALSSTEKSMQQLVDSAEIDNIAFDQMISEGNTEGFDIISSAINALVAQTSLIEQVASVLGIDNLNPDTADHQF